MALQISYTDPATRAVLPACYGRIHYMNIDALGGTVDVAVGLYINKAARDAGGTPLVVWHGWPPIAQVASVPIPVDLQSSLYSWLKTQGIFVGATDV